MATSYTITIKNATTTGGRRYNIISDVPSVKGGANPPVKSVVWKTTGSVQRSGQAKFRYMPEFYGFVGSSTVNSAELKANNGVDLQYSEPVKPGYITNNGTQLFVNESEELTEIGQRASNGTFQIIMDSGLNTPNRSVVGLARLEEDGIPAPVAAVELKPGVQYAFTPNPAVYVIGGSVAEGRVVDAPGPDAKFARVEFRGNQKEAIVIEQNDGAFTTQYL